MANPFYIKQANPMQGLNSMIGAGKDIGSAIQQESADNEKQSLRQEANELFQSGTPEEINAFAAANPWIVEERAATGKNRGELTKQSVVQTARDILINNVDPSIAFTDSAKRAHAGGASGAESIEMARQSKEDPQKGVRAAEVALALYGESGDLKAYRKAAGLAKDDEAKSASEAEFDMLTADFSPAEKRKAKRIKLGLDPRAVGSAVQTITKDGNVDEIADTSRILKGAEVEGGLLAELKLKPEVSSAVALAVSKTKRAFEREGEAVDNAKVFNIYDTAMRGLADSLSSTTTGPGMSYMPALTADAQIMEGARAAFAPVMKQIFRESGEGTFTKDDQEILMAMLPGRDDLPEAAAAKLANVDTIVRAKLKQPPATAALPQGVTEDDITATMQANKMTREQVLARLSGGQ